MDWMDIVFFHSSFFSFLIFNSRYWTSNSSFFKVSSSIFLLGLEQLVRPLLNGSIHEDGDGGGGDSGSRMWGTVSGGPSIILIPLQKMWRLKFCLSVDVTIFGVLWFLQKHFFINILFHTWNDWYQWKVMKYAYLNKFHQFCSYSSSYLFFFIYTFFYEFLIPVILNEIV